MPGVASSALAAVAGEERRRLLKRSKMPTVLRRRVPEPTPPLDVFSVRCSRCSSVKVFDSHQGRYAHHLYG